MVLSNIKKRAQDRGFTIVELLIVIVVIGILAAIVIVAYSGITAKGNLQKTVTNATAVRDVAEAYNADNGKYPALTTDFAAGTTTKLPAGITVLRGPAGALTSNVFTSVQLATVLPAVLSLANAPTSVAYSPNNASPVTGGVIIYWDTVANVVTTNYIYTGAATAASTFIQPAS